MLVNITIPNSLKFHIKEKINSKMESWKPAHRKFKAITVVILLQNNVQVEIIALTLNQCLWHLLAPKGLSIGLGFTHTLYVQMFAKRQKLCQHDYALCSILDAVCTLPLFSCLFVKKKVMTLSLFPKKKQTVLHHFPPPCTSIQCDNN